MLQYRFKKYDLILNFFFFYRTTVLEESKEDLPIAKEINYKIDAWIRAFHHIANAFFYLVYDVPMVRRVQISN